jgi:ArsR family transcriptional regulator, zinc-responsive transcriptional repressor
MGVTKTDLFDPTTNAFANAAKAFAHPARVAIIKYLLETKACINGDLVEELGLAQATISQHLRELKQIGIIQGNIEGTRVNYCINSKKWLEIKEQFNQLFDQYPNPQDCC